MDKDTIDPTTDLVNSSASNESKDEENSELNYKFKENKDIENINCSLASNGQNVVQNNALDETTHVDSISNVIIKKEKNDLLDESNEQKNADFITNEFYNEIQKILTTYDQKSSLNYITSRSTLSNVSMIEKLLGEIETCCKNKGIPVGEKQKPLSIANEMSIDLFKYLICNTKFASQPLLANDIKSGHFVNRQPPLSTYLFLEILWNLHFEKILAESILYLPIDLCYEILEILPRCLDLLGFQRGIDFLSIILPNAYRKLLILRDTGSQSQDISKNIEKLIGSLHELIIQFNNERFVKLREITLKSERYKKQGILFKKIIQTVKKCFIFQLKTVQISPDMENLYKLTFGQETNVKIDDAVLVKYLKEIDRSLMNLLLEKVKEIDGHIYFGWMDHEDEDLTSLTLQRAVGLECYYFIEHTKKYKEKNDDEYNHLIECLQQLSSKPDPENKLESLQIEDLSEGVNEGKKENLMSLFKRYKEWNNNTIDLIDKNIHLLSKEDCEELFEYFAEKINSKMDQLHLEKLQSFTLRLFKAFLGLKLIHAYELTIQCILRYGENNSFQYVVDIGNFERFIMLNPNISSSKNLKIVLFYLCFQSKLALKIILKIAIGHSDYPDVAINLEDLMSLRGIMKIKIPSQYEVMIHALHSRSLENKKTFEPNISNGVTNGDSNLKNLRTVSLVVKLLQEICLDGSKWTSNKFSDLLYMLYSFCEFSEIVKEIFTPLLMLQSCPANYVKWALEELSFLNVKINSKLSMDLCYALDIQALNLLKMNNISRFTINESLILIVDQIKRFFNSDYKPIHYNYAVIFLEMPVFPKSNTCLTDHIGRIIGLYREKTIDSQYSDYLKIEDIIRYLFFKCTDEQYSNYIKEIDLSFDKEILNWSTKVNAYDKIIRLEFESCLLSLEFPEICPKDFISFSIRRLQKLISTMKNPQINSYFVNEVCKSLEAHAVLLNKNVIKHTSISSEYNQLLIYFNEAQLEIDSYLSALDFFAYGCAQKSSSLNTYEGPHSALGIKLCLVHDIIDKLIIEEIIMEEQLIKLSESFK